MNAGFALNTQFMDYERRVATSVLGATNGNSSLDIVFGEVDR